MGGSSLVRYCAVPLCPTPLWKHNVSGVCRKHLHIPPYCHCARCAPQSAHLIDYPNRTASRHRDAGKGGLRRYSVPMTAEVWQAVWDKSQVTQYSLDTIIGTLLARAVQRGDLDLHFPPNLTRLPE